MGNFVLYFYSGISSRGWLTPCLLYLGLHILWRYSPVEFQSTIDRYWVNTTSNILSYPDENGKFRIKQLTDIDIFQRANKHPISHFWTFIFGEDKAPWRPSIPLIDIGWTRLVSVSVSLAKMGNCVWYIYSWISYKGLANILFPILGLHILWI